MALKKQSFSKPQLIVFALAFGIIGLILVRTFAANPNLPGDINNDNTVNITDLSILLTNYGTTNATADLNADNTVNITDLSILLSHYGQSTTGLTTLPPSTINKNIDGNLSESDWKLTNTVSKTVGGTANNTTTFGFLWDKNYLYLGAKVLDSSLKNDSANCWDDDSIEFYIDPNNSAGTVYDANDKQITQRWNDSSLCGISAATQGVLHAYASTTGGFSVEIAVPWSSLGVTPTSGMTVGVDVGVNDDDDGGLRDAQSMWNGTANNSSDPSAFSHLALTGTPVDTPIPTPTSTGMMVGINSAGWGISGIRDVHLAVNYNRLESSRGDAVSDYYNNGVKTVALISGTCATCAYSTGGVSSINVSTWVASAISYYQTQCQSSTANCPAIEVLNEPGGTWFWGSNAMSSANISAYNNLLIATYNGFHNQFGSGSPKIIASYDGGYAGSTSWGQQMYSANSSIGNYVDGWSLHPYGGASSTTTASAQGNRAVVTSVHNSTNKPIWITEVGWPTAVGQPSTGDSMQWTEAQQADNIYNFVQWARSTGYVDAVMIFNYRDYGTNNWYGIESSSGVKKPSFNALKCAAQNLPQNCP